MPAPATPQRDAAAFLAWLATTDRSWIVVLDDVADPGDLARLWPTGSAGRVVVDDPPAGSCDGRPRPGWSTSDVFTPPESRGVPAAKLSHVPPAVPAWRLSGRRSWPLTGYLPLALAQAAAVIVNDAMTCAGYRALLADARTHWLSCSPTTRPSVVTSTTGRWPAPGRWLWNGPTRLAPAGAARPVLWWPPYWIPTAYRKRY